MKQHLYRITVEHLADADGNPVDATPLQFNAPNHDEISRIIDYIQGRGQFSDTDAQRFAVGLKLMGEVILEGKDNAFCKELRPYFGDLMKIVKKGEVR
ncbi:DUF3861 domain-containing protein [Lonepinella koalarum]